MNRAINEIVAKKAEAILKARSDLLAFTLYTKGDYEVNWHHRLMCDKLNQFIMTDKLNHLMIFVPPQTGKSELSSRRLPAFALGLNPDLRIALCGYGDTFTQRFNRAVQRIIDTEEYSEVFPNTRLNQKNVATTSKGNYVRTSNLFEIVGHQGFLYTTGVGGPLTGTTVDLAIIDDPVKDRQSAKSKAVKTQTWEWYTDVMRTRLHNYSKQLVLMTRWEEDDLAGRILDADGLISEGGKWTVIKYEGLREDMSDKEDPRKYGQALWPDRHSWQTYNDIKQNNPRTFISLYQQAPAPMDGDILKREYFDIIDHTSLPIDFFNRTVHFTVDTAYGTKNSNDPSGIMGFIKYGNDLYVVYFYKARLPFHKLLKKLEQKIKAVGSKNSAVFIEPKASGISVIQEMRRLTDLNIIRHKMITGDKEERTNTLEPYYEAGRVKIVNGRWTASFIQSLMSFPNAKHDEEVDCLNMAVIEGLVRGKGSMRNNGRKIIANQ